MLKPGEEVQFNSWVGGPAFRNAERGTVKVAVRYFNLPDLKWKGLPLGEHDPKAMERIKGSTRITLESNVVEIVVGD